MMISWTLEQWFRLNSSCTSFQLQFGVNLWLNFLECIFQSFYFKIEKKKRHPQRKNVHGKIPRSDSQICCQLRSKPPNQVAFYPLQTKQLLPLPSEPAVLQVVGCLLLSSLEERLRIFKHGCNIFQLKKLHYSLTSFQYKVSVPLHQLKVLGQKKNQTFTPHQLAVLAWNS